MRCHCNFNHNRLYKDAIHAETAKNLRFLQIYRSCECNDSVFKVRYVADIVSKY